MVTDVGKNESILREIAYLCEFAFLLTVHEGVDRFGGDPLLECYSNQMLVCFQNHP